VLKAPSLSHVTAHIFTLDRITQHLHTHWTLESAKQRNAAAPEQGKIYFSPSILYNLYYIAPEVQGLIDPCQENPGAMDMWSLGIIVYCSGD
jgi:serine/threonine protein kinase